MEIYTEKGNAYLQPIRSASNLGRAAKIATGLYLAYHLLSLPFIHGDSIIPTRVKASAYSTVDKLLKMEDAALYLRDRMDNHLLRTNLPNNFIPIKKAFSELERKLKEK